MRAPPRARWRASDVLGIAVDGVRRESERRGSRLRWGAAQQNARRLWPTGATPHHWNLR